MSRLEPIRVLDGRGPDSKLSPMGRFAAFTRRLLPAAAFVGALLLPLIAAGQGKPNALTDAELDRVRELGNQPNERVAYFQKIMDERIANIVKLTAAKRVNDRGGQLHDLMNQFASLADELDDNFDDYQGRNWDVRKALRKLIEVSAGWPDALSQPPPDAAYDVTRKIALQAAADIHENAQKLLDYQTDYFKVHPQAKERDRRCAGDPVVIPR